MSNLSIKEVAKNVGGFDSETLFHYCIIVTGAMCMLLAALVIFNAIYQLKDGEQLSGFTTVLTIIAALVLLVGFLSFLTI